MNQNYDLTSTIIKCVYAVSNTLGAGFLEKVYENALMIELQQNGIDVENQKSMSVTYRGQIVGEYYADIVAENTVVLELKACNSLTPEHSAQLINYLKAGSPKQGLLINFGSAKPEFKKLFG